MTTYRRTPQLSTAEAAYIDGEDTVALLEQVEPHLRTYKRQRARLILRDYLRLTPRNGKYSEAMRRERLAFELAVQSIKPNRSPDS